MGWLGASAALAILSFDVDAEAPILVEGRRHAQNPSAMSHQAYGPLVAMPRILGLLAEHGLRYDSSLMDDDRPYVLETAHGPLAELPPHWSLDDWNQYMYLPEPRSGSGTIQPPSRAVGLWREELDGMRRHGCLFVLTMHPFLSGRPGRVEALRGLVEHALGAGDVEFVSCAEAARRTFEDETLPRRSLRRY